MEGRREGGREGGSTKDLIVDISEYFGLRVLEGMGKLIARIAGDNVNGSSARRTVAEEDGTRPLVL